MTFDPKMEFQDGINAFALSKNSALVIEFWSLFSLTLQLLQFAQASALITLFVENIKMVPRSLFVMAIALVLGSARSDAATISFNGLAGTPIPTGGIDIGGFTFSAGSAGPIVVVPNIFTSSDSLFLNGSSVTITRTVGGAAFNLDQLVASGSGGVLVTNFGNFGAPFVDTGTTLLRGGNPVFANLTAITISSVSSPVFLDDITLSEVAPAAVPEPASSAILGFGSLALVVRRMRRRSLVVA